MSSPIWFQLNYSKCRTCMLMVTHKCNLNCTYCYESYKSNKNMNFETAKRCILHEVETVKNDNRFDSLEIQFMGGEPFANFPLIKNVVEWAEDSKELSVPHKLFATSNGTLFNDGIKQWCKKHKESFCVGVSLDGTSEMQKTNRGVNNIDFEFFHKTWPKQSFHMTVSQDTLPNLAEGILQVQKRGYGLTVALASGVGFTNQDAVTYNKQLSILSKAYLNDDFLEPVMLLSRFLYIPNNIDKLSKPQRKYCGTGSHMIAYDVDGKAYGCHMFTPLVLGKRALEINRIDWCSRSENNEDPYCKRCILKNICPTCAGFNLRYRGDIALRDQGFCKMMFIQALRSCEFQIKAAVSKRTSFNDEEVKFAKAAYDAYHVLKKFDVHDLKDPEQIPTGPWILQ